MKFMPDRLIALRTAQGITRAEAARRLSMSAMGYGRYEKGERTPSYQTVSFMAQFFNTSTDYLYGVSDDAAPLSITLRASDDPDLFLLVQTAQADKDMIPRLLAYAERLKSLEPG
ncbi:MAG: helix-turn-helix transcriptional regulator [Lachnospiraceae bacterium]|nr:helix-turn-helix transcriptional regulator [Lachnospiraceae bacterium]